jgi:hypothetical protein
VNLVILDGDWKKSIITWLLSKNESWSENSSHLEENVNNLTCLLPSVIGFDYGILASHLSG